MILFEGFLPDPVTDIKAIQPQHNARDWLELISDLRL
jgi:hypothetical protein